MSINPRCDRSKKAGAQVDPTWGLYETSTMLIGETKCYATYPEFVADKCKKDFGYVKDATGDSTVSRGAALYAVRGKLYTKIWEEEAGPGPTPAEDSITVKIVHEAMSGVVSRNTHYVTDADMDVTLPTDARKGNVVRISIMEGGENSTIRPAAGQTLDGQSEEVAMNVSGMTYQFTFDSVDSNWIQF